MDDLTSRQKKILQLVIESYIATSVPVASRMIAQKRWVALSPASIRHEMGALEERGYLTHPHTSAGRTPTDKGYHCYVHEMIREEPVSASFLDLISREMEGKIGNLESLIEHASRILSAITEETVLVSAPTLEELCLKELNLVSLSETRLLAVWRTTSGLIQNCWVEMEEAICSGERERIRNFINAELAGEPIDRLGEKLTSKMELRRDSLKRLYERALQVIQEGIPQWFLPRLHVEGSHYILKQPEFQDLKKFRLLIETLEEKTDLIHLLTGFSVAEGVRVAIGEKELSKNIWDCSLISAPYGAQGKSLGVVSVLGPRRMRYGRLMGLVHRMAGEISEALERWRL